MIIFCVVLLVTVLFILFYVDKKRVYNDIPIVKWSKDNGETYFAVSFFIWELNKKEKAKNIYIQNTTLDVEGYKYIITEFYGEFPKTSNGLFFEKELRYGGHPLSINETSKNEYLTINQYGNGIINIESNKEEITNEIINIQEYISNDVHIDFADKKVMQDFINKILNEETMEKKEVEVAYDTFLKYEPLLSISLSIISLVKDIFIK